eukprot:3131018-Rhodomonas_salina.1
MPGSGGVVVHSRQVLRAATMHDHVGQSSCPKMEWMTQLSHRVCRAVTALAWSCNGVSPWANLVACG